MSAITAQQVRAAAKGRVNESNLASVLVALDKYGERFGMDRPHRLAQYFAQLMHESGDFRYDREIWGATPAQRATTPALISATRLRRTETGTYTVAEPACNSPAKTTINSSATGAERPASTAPTSARIRTRSTPIFGKAWCLWDTRDLNRWADEGDAETITKKINGGKNGLADRFDRLARTPLVLLRYRADNVLQFQADQRLQVDGDVGPKTRAAMHTALVALTPGEAGRPEVKAAPVTEEKPVPVPVMPPSLDAPWWKSKEVITPSVIGGGASLLTAIGGIPWQNLLLILVAFGGIAGFLYWRKNADRKAVAKQVEGMA
nr:peptidoglycan-binding protein [Sinorhizobium meliloti]